ncbi:hypothetical protein BHE74_00008243 [Ensete ventricosum]|nr:hypothetical protein BHE74_00008243 [Ensete ventricosum]RZR86305.1 hypothetical protein BHM03_00013484 [Ensete ventricosum]
MRNVEFRSISHAKSFSKIQNTSHSQCISPSSDIQNTDHSQHISSLEVIHIFAKKCDGHKLCVKSRAKSSFDLFFVHRLKNSKY